MKRRLAEPSLPLPLLTLARKQPITEKPAAVPDHSVLQEILVIANQNEFDQLRMVQEINVDPSCAVVEDVTEFSSPTTEHSQRVTTGERHIANQEVRFRARRTEQHVYSSNNPKDSLLLVLSQAFLSTMRQTPSGVAMKINFGTGPRTEGS